VDVPVTINGEDHRIVTTFNRAQAKVGQDILNQSHENRIQWGTQMLNFMESLRVTKKLSIDTHISATLKQGNIVVQSPVNLHWRCMRMLALCCVSGQDALITRVSDVLKNIEAGL